MSNENNNEKKRFGRRAGAGIVYAVILLEILHLVVFKSLDLVWFEIPAKFFTFALAFVVSGLTLTDLLSRKK